MPTSRVYFDIQEPASYYQSALQQLEPHSYVMGEVLDSSDMKSVTPTQEHQRVADLISTLGSDVDIWEVGNEVNGNWTGPYSTGASMVTDAYDQVTAAGGRTALTLYYNAGCGDGPSELDPITYANDYLPAEVRNGLDYVLISYYQTQCNGQVLSTGTVTNFMEQLHGVFPNAQLGFGEVGLPGYVSSSTEATAESIVSHYYSLPIDLPYYIGGYFYWGFKEDAIPVTKPLFPVLASAMETEAAVLGGTAAVPTTTTPTTAPPTTSTTTPTTPTTTSAVTTTPVTTTPVTTPPVTGDGTPAGLPSAFSSLATANWSEGGGSGGWTDQWNGYGTAGVVNDPASNQNVLQLSPEVSSSASETHSALVTTSNSYASPTFSVSVRTVAQLREGSAPNPWETGWVLWDYTPDDSFYAVVLKPNGWEVDKETQGSQQFLQTGSSPTFPVGQWYQVGVSQNGSTISVTVNGQPLTTLVDDSYHAGALGLYCEDSTADFGGVSLQPTVQLGAARSVTVPGVVGTSGRVR